MSVSLAGVLLFGPKISNDLLLNISKRPGTVSVLIRSAYSIVLLFHLPYFFFSIKEYTLVVLDEVLNRSLSTNLELKLADFYKQRQEKKNEQDEQPSVPAAPDHSELVGALEARTLEAEETDALINRQTDGKGVRAGADSNNDRPESDYSASLTVNSTKSALTYQSLPDSYFFWTAVVLHATILTLSMSVNSLDIIFEISGAVGCSALMFLFPGTYYILALRKYGRPSHYQQWTTFFYRALAWAYIALFVLINVAFIYTEGSYLFSSGVQPTTGLDTVI